VKYNNIMKQCWISSWLALLLFLGMATVLSAHPGTGAPQLTNEDIGPYRIFVWSDPEPPQIGEYHVILALTESLANDPSGFAGKPIFDAEVTVSMTNLQSGETLVAKATHEDATNRIFYEAVFQVPSAGDWRVDLAVAGPDGPAEATYVDEFQVASFNWRPILWGGLALLFAAGALIFHWRVQPQTAEATQ
jgi:hypothetical protein